MSVRSLRRRIDRLLAGALAGLMACLVGLVCWQVFTRFVLGDPSSVSEEAARFLLIWLGLMGAARALGQRMHLAIDLAGHRVTALRRPIQLFGRSVCALFAAAVLVAGGWWLVVLTLELGQTSPALGWRLGYVYLALPASGLLMVFYAATDDFAEPGA